MSIVFHADDYGITLAQAKAILALSSACGGKGVLESASIFANSPAFDEAARLAAPFVASGALKMSVHLNLVEGAPCKRPEDIPLLVNDRGTFAHDFIGLMRLARGPQRAAFKEQATSEFAAQIERFARAFPSQRDALRLDSHQHTHAVPLLFDAMLDAIARCEGSPAYIRMPAEPLSPYRIAQQTSLLSPVNLAKDVLLSHFCAKNAAKVPRGCTTALFCGVALSGRMERMNPDLVRAFEQEAERRSRPVEMLFHPVSVPIQECLDPQNSAFAEACASPARDNEARTLVELDSVANKRA